MAASLNDRLAGLRTRAVQDTELPGTDDELQTLAYELTVAEARERERIARDLHDELGQLLSIAQLMVGELQQRAGARQGRVLEELRALINDAARATRSVTFELSCPILRLGLTEALHSVAQRVSRSGLQMRLEGEVPAVALAEPVLAVLFRVVRELALNVQKHSGASLAWIRPDCNGSVLRIGVVDDGVGFDPASCGGFSRDGGFGLVSARAQMRAIGGALEIDSAPGSGTRAVAVLPLPGR